MWWKLCFPYLCRVATSRVFTQITGTLKRNGRFLPLTTASTTYRVTVPSTRNGSSDSLPGRLSGFSSTSGRRPFSCGKLLSAGCLLWILEGKHAVLSVSARLHPHNFFPNCQFHFGEKSFFTKHWGETKGNCQKKPSCIQMKTVNVLFSSMYQRHLCETNKAERGQSEFEANAPPANLQVPVGYCRQDLSETFLFLLKCQWHQKLENAQHLRPSNNFCVKKRKITLWQESPNFRVRIYVHGTSAIC